MRRHASLALGAEEIMEVSVYEMETHQLTHEDDALALAFMMDARQARQRPHHVIVHEAQRRAARLAVDVAEHGKSTPWSSLAAGASSSSSVCVDVRGEGESVTGSTRDGSSYGKGGDDRYGFSFGKGCNRYTTEDEFTAEGHRWKSSTLTSLTSTCDVLSYGKGNDRCNSGGDVSPSRDATAEGHRWKSSTSINLTSTCDCDGLSFGECSDRCTTEEDVSPSRDATVEGHRWKSSTSTSLTSTFDGLWCGEGSEQCATKEDISQPRDAIAKGIRWKFSTSTRMLKSYLPTRMRVMPENDTSEVRSHLKSQHREQVPQTSSVRSKTCSIMRSTRHEKHAPKTHFDALFCVKPIEAVDGHVESFDEATCDHFGYEPTLHAGGDAQGRRSSASKTCFFGKSLSRLKGVIEKGRASAS
eukprot:TRINITY_DN6100_c1_g7_i1.p1 TRINITY_DN6100_c1_g7~~TRINITY_DN6100_c1_g7_i1.p1  ORF type:complete len:414 (+),score=48.83 TRINITY_DN6100_c1_g7_i1:61-1302(+)